MKQPISRLARWAVLAVSPLVLSACNKGLSDLQEKIASIKEESKKNVSIEAIPTITEPDPKSLQFIPNPKRDPFGLPKDDESDGVAHGLRPDMNRRKEELEQYALDSLDMVGTLGKGGDETALVKDPSGVIHRVRIGNYLGQNFGRIIGIHEDRIELIELESEGEGKWKERSASIALGDK